MAPGRKDCIQEAGTDAPEEGKRRGEEEKEKEGRGECHQVVSGGFSQVFQARPKRWRTQHAIKCSLCLQKETTRQLTAHFHTGETEVEEAFGLGSSEEGMSWG